MLLRVRAGLQEILAGAAVWSMGLVLHMTEGTRKGGGEGRNIEGRAVCDSVHAV